MSGGVRCPCGHVHSFGDVRSIGRFQPNGPTGYVAYVNGKTGPARSTRREAMNDVCPLWKPPAHTTPTTPAAVVVSGTESKEQ
ncbi:MAG: hypothetical protein JWO46_747 [Nocardioidaceae bacterium]|nr:hypothetical protein [Nocardioidaceae bacterium]